MRYEKGRVTMFNPNSCIYSIALMLCVNHAHPKSINHDWIVTPRTNLSKNNTNSKNRDLVIHDSVCIAIHVHNLQNLM